MNGRIRKHIFIINPRAGSSRIDFMLRDVRAIWDASGEEYEFYETTAPGDGEAYARKACQRFADELGLITDCDPAGESDGNNAGSDATAVSEGDGAVLRFYACGGDGTLNEVVNGSFGYDFVEAGCFPMGTGNDFVRNFPDRDFSDPMAQFRGEAVPCDLIRYDATLAGSEVAHGEFPFGDTCPEDHQAKHRSHDDPEVMTRYCVNMFNIGFDCNVVDTTDRLKKLPLIGGSFAYLCSVAVNLLEKKGADLFIIYPDGFVYQGKLLLLSVANGCFCGGGIKGLPRARTDDGLMDVSLVQDVPRSTFVKLFPKYQVGTHLEDPRTEDFLKYSQEPSLTVFPSEGSIKLCVDGEIHETGPVNFTTVPKAFRFVLPQHATKD